MLLRSSLLGVLTDSTRGESVSVPRLDRRERVFPKEVVVILVKVGVRASSVYSAPMGKSLRWLEVVIVRASGVTGPETSTIVGPLDTGVLMGSSGQANARDFAAFCACLYVRASSLRRRMKRAMLLWPELWLAAEEEVKDGECWVNCDLLCAASRSLCSGQPYDFGG